MIREPRKNGGPYDKAGSLLFFVLAVLIVIFGALLEQMQHFSPLHISGSGLLLLLLAGLLLLIFGLRGKLR